MENSLALVVKQLSFRYRNREDPALQTISFSAQKGELLLIVGASGCGKTSLLRAINGLIPRSYKGELSGRIQVNGQDTASMALSDISQRVGTVLQDPERQILGTRVLNEVAFGLENLGLPREEILQRTYQALLRMNITHLAERETFSLSGGEKQKVALAGVLAMQPSILLLDEPLASLDPVSAWETLDIVRELANEGMTVLMVEHRIEDVLRIHPDRVLALKNGALHYLGKIDNLPYMVDYRTLKLPAETVIQVAGPQPPAPISSTFSGNKGAGESAASPIVVMEHVSFEYSPGIQVIHDVHLDIRKGDVIALLGPNGAGKTTFVKHAIGLLKPRLGRVLVNGRDTREASVAEIAATLGYVFQSPSHMLFASSVQEELAFGPKNLKHPREKIQEEVAQALQTVRLQDRAADAPLSLSFGQQKRVSIASILAMRSKILVMDEPTAGQDYENYTGFMDSILQMPNLNAVLFITHDLDLALIYANRVILMADGAIQADGNPQDVLSDFALLRKCRILPTSLLQANLNRLKYTGRFLRAEALAQADREYSPGPILET